MCVFPSSQLRPFPTLRHIWWAVASSALQKKKAVATTEFDLTPPLTLWPDHVQRLQVTDLEGVSDLRPCKQSKRVLEVELLCIVQRILHRRDGAPAHSPARRCRHETHAILAEASPLQLYTLPLSERSVASLSSKAIVGDADFIVDKFLKSFPALSPRRCVIGPPGDSRASAPAQGQSQALPSRPARCNLFC